MSLVLPLLVAVAVTAAAVTVMLVVRRRAPKGSRFSDGDRASGVFGVLATGFSVLLGFIIFLAFAAYDDARLGAEQEATVTAQQLQTAQFLPDDASAELSGELICYARSVAGVEWTELEQGTLGERINPWGAQLYGTISTVDPQSAVEQSAYDRWMDQTQAREQARVDRVHGAQGLIPTPLWLALWIVCGVIFVFMLFFADSGERAVTQAVLMGSVALVITLMMLLINFFNTPHGEGVGHLRPTAMERTLDLIDQELEVAGIDVEVPCDELGRP